MFEDVFSKVPNGSFVWRLLHGVPLVFLEVARCRVRVFILCCGISMI